MDVEGVKCECVYWGRVALDSVWWRIVEIAVKKAMNFLTS
jgi:hypothetical protein